MTTYKCPNGHDSTTDDFCDVCGEPIKGAAATPAGATPAPDPAPAAPASSLSLDPPASSGTTSAPAKCPNCGDENPHDSLFCEACGYDFTTGQLPAAAPPPAAGVEFVAELWVDPDWFAAQEASGTCATSGAPTIVPLRGPQALVGRRSKSRGVQPDIDCSADGSVSHNHASLTLDHDRWYVEDLGSTNGTYVGMPGDPLPTTPLNPHARHELEDGERIYVGAWCRIQLRPATDTEKTL
jgi:predicted component of type VI protein secretion system